VDFLWREDVEFHTGHLRGDRTRDVHDGRVGALNVFCSLLIEGGERVVAVRVEQNTGDAQMAGLKMLRKAEWIKKFTRTALRQERVNTRKVLAQS
jgi:hypothetical protein